MKDKSTLLQREAFTPKKLHRWSLVVGNLLEHFDSSLYGFLAPVLGKVFFPQFSPLYQIILAFSVYLITFVARPFGGIFFSKLTYKYGPLRVLSWSLMELRWPPVLWSSSHRRTYWVTGSPSFNHGAIFSKLLCGRRKRHCRILSY